MQTDRPLCCTLTTRGQSLHAGQGAPMGEAAPRKAGSRPASSDRRLGSRSGAGSRRADIPRGRRGRGPPICAPGSGYSTRAPSAMLPEQGFCRRPPVTRSAGTSSAGVSSRSPDGETEGEGSDGTVRDGVCPAPRAAEAPNALLPPDPGGRLLSERVWPAWAAVAAPGLRLDVQRPRGASRGREVRESPRPLPAPAPGPGEASWAAGTAPGDRGPGR